ncbi:YfjL-like protein [Peptoniphilus sp. Marseille-Q6390]
MEKKFNFKKFFIGLTIVCALILLFFYIAFFGNPISRILAEKSATEYIEANYKDLDLIRDETFYNFKDGYYTVRLSSKKSKDTKFMLGFDSFGKLKQDTYDDILFNTEIRLLDELREYGTTIQKKYNFPYDISLNTVEDVPREDLVLDQEFDFENFNEEVSAEVVGFSKNPKFEECLDALCDLQKIMDKTSLKVTKYSVILIPEENRKPDGEAESWQNSLGVYDIPAEVVRNKDLKEFKNIYEEAISKTKD